MQKLCDWFYTIILKHLTWFWSGIRSRQRQVLCQSILIKARAFISNLFCVGFEAIAVVKISILIFGVGRRKVLYVVTSFSSQNVDYTTSQPRTPRLTMHVYFCLRGSPLQDLMSSVPFLNDSLMCYAASHWWWRQQGPLHRWYNLEDSHLRVEHRENLKSYTE